jgi:SAM-dependent methyltransferase
MVASYLSELEFGDLSDHRRRPAVETVVGIDPSPVLVAKAREIARDLTNVSFEEGDGSDLPVDGAGFDAVVVHRALSYVPKPDRISAALGEALKAEPRHRAATGTFFGHVAHASLTARKAP